MSSGYSRPGRCCAGARSAGDARSQGDAAGDPAVPRHRLQRGDDGGDRGGIDTLVFMRKWDPELAMEIIQREKVNMTGGVPTIAWQLLEHPDRANLRSLEPREHLLWRRALRARAGQADLRGVRRAARQWLGNDRDHRDGDPAFGRGLSRAADQRRAPGGRRRPQDHGRRGRRASCRSAKSASYGRAGR
jgi:hypothetical protein